MWPIGPLRPLFHLTNSFTFLRRQSKTTKKPDTNSIISLQSLNAIAHVNVTTNLKKKVYRTLCKQKFIHILTIIPSSTNEKKSVEQPGIEVCDFGNIRCVLGHVIYVVEPMDLQGAGPHHGSVRCHLTLSLPPHTLCSLHRDKTSIIDCGMGLIVSI